MFCKKEEPILNGFAKKTLFLLTLEALLYNPKANLEFHLHELVNVLMKFVTSTNISLNNSDFEIPFREKSALLLSRLINKSIKKLRSQVQQHEVQYI